MSPTEILEHEHEVILKMLTILRNISQKIESVDSETLANVIDFIRTFADKCHHAKEEKILFVEAENNGIPRDGGPIGMMLVEHDEGRSYVKGMDEALTLVKAGDRKSLTQYQEKALLFASLLEQHILKENQILYPMINMHLDDAKQNDILKQFEKAENEMGEGVHEKYYKLVSDLEARFMK